MALPSEASPELLRLVSQLWEGGDLTIVAGRRPPEGYRVVEQFVVAPSLRRARMLLPAGSRAARAGALRQYNQLRPPQVRAGRAALAAAAKLGLDGMLASQPLSVCAPVGLDDQGLADQSITHWLTHQLALGPLHTAIGVGSTSPNQKPTLQLFLPDGTPAGFAKIGWNDVTREMVDNEARALELLHDGRLSGPTAPTPLLAAPWRDLSVLATRPMPLSLRRKRPADCPAPQLRLSDVSPLAGKPADARLSTWWASIADRSRWVTSQAGSTSEDNDVIRKALSYLEVELSRQPLSTGPWHGDWVYWNMALLNGDMWVWDWEHFGADAPLGFDEFHYHFQSLFVVKRRPVDEAMAYARGLRQSSPAGLPDWLPVAYLLEIYLRAARMNALGAAWEARFHDGARRWLRQATTVTTQCTTG